MGWEYFKLHLNFRRNRAKTTSCIYSSHLQGYLKETELILDLVVLCKFIIMQLQNWQVLDLIIFGKLQEAKRGRQDLGLVSTSLPLSMILLTK